MNLFSLEIPPLYENMLVTYEHYYHVFYLEMVRMSNAILSKHLEDFLAKLVQMSRTGSPVNEMRVAIGVVALHNFGYRDFNLLTETFDRILPQSDLENVKFTSRCAGQLICHPNFEQSRYVQHLFDRSIGWIRHKGHRAKPLAAAYLIEALSENAGSSVVVFFTHLQSVMWTLVSHQSVQVIQATARAFARFTVAITNYGRNDLDSYLRFFNQLCLRLLSFGSPIKKYAALSLFRELIISNSDYFVANFTTIYQSFHEVLKTSDKHLVTIAAHTTIARLSIVDPKLFVATVADDFFEQTMKVIENFPFETVTSLCFIAKTVPEYMESKIEILKELAKGLISDPKSSFTLLQCVIDVFGAKALPLENGLVSSLMAMPCTTEYKDFFIAYTNCPNAVSPDLPTKLGQRLLKELKTESPVAAIELIAQLPPNAFVSQSLILRALNELTSSKFVEVRAVIPKAMYHLAETCKSIDKDNIIHQLMQYTVYDQSTIVRCAVLRVFLENASKELAKPEYLKFFQVFSNEDSQAARNLAFDIIAKVSKYNPMFFASITRNSLLDYFFTLRHVPSIRQRARITRTLPCLIKASLITISTYSKSFMDIAIEVLENRPMKQTFENFLEEDANIAIISGILDALALIAPIQPELISLHANNLVPLLCDFLLETEERKIALSIFNFFEVIFTPPAATIVYRTMAPMILSACSTFLAQTHSRKARIAILRIFGVIGVIETHQLPPSRLCRPPLNIDENLTRQFFQPSRDSENGVTFNPNKTEEYFVCTVFEALLKILRDNHLKEFYHETVQCFVAILNKILMFMLSYFDAFMVRFLVILEESSDVELLNYFPLLTKLVKNSQNNTAPFLSQMLSLITKRFNDNLSMKIYDLILALLDSVRDNFSHYASQLICLLIGVMDTVKTSNEIQSQKILLAFSKICVYANDLLYLVIPQICDAIVCKQTLENVRILCFNCLESIAKSTDLFEYLGPIVRATIVGLEYQESSTRNSALQFLYVLIRAQGKKFLQNAEPLLGFLKRNKLETLELKRIIATVNQSNASMYFQPILEIEPPPQREQEKSLPFSEDTIIARALTPNLGAGRHLEQWLRSFIHATISNSPSHAIRICNTLATAHIPLAYLLFKPAFLSCWSKIKTRGKKQISDSFMQLLLSNENYESVAREVIDLLVYMNQYGQHLIVDSQKLVQACLRYGNVSFALKLTTDLIDNMKPTDNSTVVSTLIEIFVQSSQWSDAMCIWNRYKMEDSMSPDILMRLKLWNVAEPIFKKKFEEEHDLRAFQGIAESLACQAKWQPLLSYFPTFKENMPRELQRDVSEFFALAAFHTGEWDVLKDVLKYAPNYSLKCTMLSALSVIHNNFDENGMFNIGGTLNCHSNYEKVKEYLNAGFELLASKPLTFFADNQRIHTDTMLSCQQLMEIGELMKWAKGSNSNEIEKVWKQRLVTAPPDFSLWFEIIGLRVPIKGTSSDNLIDHFMLRSTTLGTSIHRNVFRSLFPHFDEETAPFRERICNSIVFWMTGERTKAIESMRKIVNVLQEPVELRNRCRHYYVSWLLETDDSKESCLDAFEQLRTVIPSLDLEACKIRKPTYKPSSEKYGDNLLPNEVQKSLFISTITVDVLRKWSEVNASLTTLDPEHLTEYVTNAIDALTQCALISPSFPDVVQLLNMFFENAHQPAIFNSTAHSCIEKLHPKLLLQASPQILIQLSHATPSVAEFVHDTIFRLLKDHFHSFIFSIIVLKFSKNTARANSARQLYEEFHMLNPRAYEEVDLIRQCLLRAAVTWQEKILQRITDAFDHLSVNHIDRMVASLQSISKLVKKPKCEMHDQVRQTYEHEFLQLENILRSFASTANASGNIGPLKDWCKLMEAKLSEDVKGIRVLQLSAISTQLADKSSFILAVPGTYRPHKPIVHIEYFIGQFSVYLSKQQPKDVVIMGDDGMFYQYLLKGHEDLRLDERIMQFFSMINSLLKKSDNFRGQMIEAMFVMPLSVSHGLVQWVSGTDTLRAVVEMYRKMQNKEPLEEYIRLEQLSYNSFDFLQPVQKMQIIEKIFDEVPDTDIANVFWIKAKNAEEWLKQTNNFSISIAMTSVVGYVIGLGDRHPSNLLVDRNTGKVIHIDFGDCFERAAKRKFLPEVVPFRLTRMMVKAMGITGADGLFKHTFINMSILLRENKRVLIMVLAVFVHEPLIDPDNASVDPSAIDDIESLPTPVKTRVLSKATTGSVIDKGRVYMTDITEKEVLSSVEMRNRVNQKLSGTDFESSDKPLSVEEQAIRLINAATDHYNLGMMYSGWCPFW